MREVGARATVGATRLAWGRGGARSATVLSLAMSRRLMGSAVLGWSVQGRPP